eukprot:g31025.t1
MTSTHQVQLHVPRIPQHVQRALNRRHRLVQVPALVPGFGAPRPLKLGAEGLGLPTQRLTKQPFKLRYNVKMTAPKSWWTVSGGTLLQHLPRWVFARGLLGPVWSLKL